MIYCAQPDPTQPIAERLAGYLDCQSQSIAQNGFANLSGGWLGPALLGGCLTIYVALIGYRLLLGSPFGPREAVLAAIRAGVVIAIATSWPAYEAAIYRVAIEGPAEVASQLLPAGLASPSLADAARRLDEDYKELQIAAPGRAGSASAESPGGDPPSLPSFAPPAVGQGAAPPAPSPAQSGGAASMLDRGGLLLVMVTVGSLGALRLAGGLLLGLGPLFIVLGLFDSTLGLLEGWGRALFGVFVGTAGSIVVTALQLGFIEAQITQAGPDQPGALGEADLLVIGLLFAAAMVVVLVLAVVVGLSFRIVPLFVRRGAAESSPAGVRRTVIASGIPDAPISDPAQRAQSVADAVRRLGRRETAAVSGATMALSAEGASAARIQVVAGRPSAAAVVAPTGADGGALSYRSRPSHPRTPSAESRNRLQ